MLQSYDNAPVDNPVGFVDGYFFLFFVGVVNVSWRPGAGKNLDRKSVV